MAQIESKWPMVEMADAFNIVIEEAKKAADQQIEETELRLLKTGMVLAEDLYSKEDFPAFAASTMDGYALKGPIDSTLKVY